MTVTSSPSKIKDLLQDIDDFMQRSVRGMGFGFGAPALPRLPFPVIP